MDIVERLMRRVDGVVFPDELAREAAAEIEELRRQLRATRKATEESRPIPARRRRRRD